MLCIYRRFYYHCTRVNRQMDMFVLPPRVRTISISYSRYVQCYFSMPVFYTCIILLYRPLLHLNQNMIYYAVNGFFSPTLVYNYNDAIGMDLQTTLNNSRNNIGIKTIELIRFEREK